MIKKKNIVVFSAMFLFSLLQAAPKDAMQWQRISVKHKEFNGVGYDSGYTSLDFFFAKSFQPSSVNFLDVRTHVLNTGSFALNAGLGYRYLLNTKLPVFLGINGYYDYRLNNNLSYNQIALGLEALNSRFEARINGYLPLGAQNRVDTSLPSSYQALNFQGHYLLIGQNNRSSSLGEIDSEIGVHFWPTPKKDLDLYVGAGPYYLQVPHGSAAAGVAARVSLSMSRYVTATATYSYDRFYKNIGQGEIAFNIPLGKDEEIDSLASMDDGNLAYFLNQRSSQDVYRQEIIPTKIGVGGVIYAIDPRTENPYYFVFVDNTSNSEGTFESPYPTLLQAQNNSSPFDVIYVYPGDGTTKGMDAGIILQNDQWMFGASIEHPIPVLNISSLVVIPPLAKTIPNITNTTDFAINLANRNIISGFFIDGNKGAYGGVFGENISNVIFDQNQFTGSDVTGSSGIVLINPSDDVQITNCIFNDFTHINSNPYPPGIGCFLGLDGSTISNFNFFNNKIKNINSTTQIAAGVLAIIESGTLLNMQVRNVDVSNIGLSSTSPTAGIVVLNNGGQIESVVIDNCSFSNGANGVVFAGALVNAGNFNTFQVSNCSFDTINGIYGATAQVSSGVLSTVIFKNNRYKNIGLLGVLPTAACGAEVNGGSIGSCTITDSYYENVGPSSSCAALTVSGGTTDAFVVNNSTFKNINGTISQNGVGALVQLLSGLGLVNTVQVENNQFDTITNLSRGVAIIVDSGSIDNMLIKSNDIKGLSGSVRGVEVNFNSAGSSISNISNNTFSGSGLNGWGAHVLLTAGSTCLAMSGNNSNPLASPPDQPILLEQAFSGTFNLESSDGAITGVELANNNITINTNGSITYVAEGTCQ
ncbi:MAG: inverse autotransporter beta domain-containing protein [Chlamydiia bacterium]